LRKVGPSVRTLPNTAASRSDLSRTAFIAFSFQLYIACHFTGTIGS
jgi:hypothetical protein